MQSQEVHLINKKNEETIIDVSQYFRIIMRHKWSIFGVVISFIIFASYYLNKAVPIYSATVKMQADPVQPNASSADQYIANSMVYLYYETQYEIIRSRNIAETVVDKLNLIQKYKNQNSWNNNDVDASLINNFISIFESDNIQNDRSKEAPSDEKIKTLLAQDIQAALRVEGGTQSQIINLYYESDDPVLAAAIANAIADAYSEFGLKTRLDRLKDTSSWLSEQLEDLKTTLQNSEQKLREFRVSQNLMDTGQQERIASTQLQNLNAELIQAQTKMSQSQELFSQVENLGNTIDEYLSLGPVMANASIRELVKEQGSASRKVEELSKRYGEKHPKMIAAKSELSGIRINLNTEVNKVIDNVRKDYRLKQVQVANIRNLIEKTTSELQNYQGDSFELTRLEREVENNRRIYESFLSKLMETNVSSDYDASNIRIIDRATIPKFPIKPRKGLIISIAIFIGLLLGVAYAFVKELLGNTFKTPDQIEEELSISSLGITPLVSKRRSKVTPELQYIADQRSTFSESINSIRTGLLFSNVDNPPTTVLITSSKGSEGKTTLSINLAVALSQMDKTVIIELDLRKPAFRRDLNIKPKYGLTDFLNGSEEKGIYNTTTDAPNLSIITSGTIPPNPIELISSAKFKNLLEKLRKEFKYIVIDSPPTLPVSDSCVLAKLVDATIVAVKAEDTTLNMAKETISRLEKVNANIAGIVLTQASAKKMSYYGNHYYQDKYYGLNEN